MDKCFMWIILNDSITTTKQSTTKPCAYFLGYTVCKKSVLIHKFILISITHCFVPAQCTKDKNIHYFNVENAKRKKHVCHRKSLILKKCCIILYQKYSNIIKQTIVSIVLLISGNVLEDLLLWCHRLISDMALIMMTWWFETPLRSLWRHCNVAATASLTRRSMFAQGSPSFQRSLRPVLATGPLLRNWATVVGVLPKSLNGQPHLDSAMLYKLVIRAPNRPYHVLNVVPSSPWAKTQIFTYRYHLGGQSLVMFFMYAYAQCII